MILGEIGNISRFSNPSKLLAYADLDATVNQSGKFNAKSTKMSKRGSKLLRYALINAAWNVSLNTKTFNDYFNLKRSQGNNHYAALGHVAHKLVRIIFKMPIFRLSKFLSVGIIFLLTIHSWSPCLISCRIHVYINAICF